jgi:hypothetical protein
MAHMVAVGDVEWMEPSDGLFLVRFTPYRAPSTQAHMDRRYRINTHVWHVVADPTPDGDFCRGDSEQIPTQHLLSCVCGDGRPYFVVCGKPSTICPIFTKGYNIVF